MYASIQHKLDLIRSLPICELSKRQPALVDLLVWLVNTETCHGELTSSSCGLESQNYWASLQSLTKDAGFKMLGNGHFSAAYSHPMLPGKVIKVGFKKEDSGAAYVAFCRMHQGRKGIPVIHDVQRHASCYTVVLDELVELDAYTPDPTNYPGAPEDEAVEWVYEHMEPAVHTSDAGWKDHLKYCDESDILILEEHAELIETCRMVHHFFHGLASFDMHRGNVMVTKSGELVLTDPVSFSHDRERECFPIDPEELLKEIEEDAQAKRIAGSIRRKALRDPESTARLHKVARGKANRERKACRKKNLKIAEREQAELQAAMREERKKMGVLEVIDFGRLENLMVANVFQGNKRAIALDAEFKRVRANDFKAVAFGANDLMIDRMMQGRLMG